eukprot:c3801_g1_i1.p1 GENE.c3801_g1_i1~~c3801_g1_i1.p1  ORF type:complete len:239 (+),score=105.08 c3801_g1_i1:22-738(+)
MRICVFCSSSPDTPEKYLQAARDLAKAIVEGGHTCINGGAEHGCMGALNAECVRLGGKVIGVIHESWVVEGAAFSGIELRLATGSTLHQRKQILFEQSDCFIALPGGFGTWDELFEILSERQLGIRNNPVCVLNIDGFYDGVIEQFEKGVSEKLLKHHFSKLVFVTQNAQEAVDHLAVALKNPVILEAPFVRPKTTAMLRRDYLPSISILLLGFAIGYTFQKKYSFSPNFPVFNLFKK